MDTRCSRRLHSHQAKEYLRLHIQSSRKALRPHLSTERLFNLLLRLRHRLTMEEAEADAKAVDSLPERLNDGG